uniref:FERM domain-containing protein n=1 Tax=Romanomermis culicivorax TaxID=13658 RepID=A0A915JV50_ROMCU
LCDVLSRWEKSLKEVTAGRIPTNRVIQLAFKQRFYWRHLCQDRTDKETLFQAYDSCKEVKNDRIPVSTELAVELCALFCQTHFGKCKKCLSDDQALDSAVKRCLPDKLIAASCKNTLRQRILDRWGELTDKGMSAADSASSIILALKLWPHFGSKMFDATLKWKAEEPVLLAVSDLGLTILEAYTMDQINTYPFESIIKFGGLRNDFVVVVHRPSYSENESSQERLIFGMAKLQIYEATLYIADYIKARRGVYLKQTCSFSPRRQILVESRKL